MVTMKTKNPADKHVGARIRLRRMMIGKSQQWLGDKLGVTFQQVQKYEKGINRIGGSRMQQISGILKAPVSFFFEGVPGGQGETSADVTRFNEFATNRDGLELVSLIQEIGDSNLTRSLVGLLQALKSRTDGGVA